jgi:GH25 family lysozyme M1 (1,4-beta-N-acetylmuramidase)
MSIKLVICATLASLLSSSASIASEFDRPWQQFNRGLILDAYELNSIDWPELVKDRRIVGFINKATDGLPPVYDCRRGKTKLSRKLCREQFRKYAITRELYHSRKLIASGLGLKWGAYHLGRPGNPIDQANHFINFTNPDANDLIALDIEHNDPKKWMSLEDAEIFATHIKNRLGRYPLLYVNGSTAQFIADNSLDYPVLSRLQLWYARYKPNISAVFPLGEWASYSIWQFSYQGNCTNKKCPYRISGAPADIDVNVTRYDIRGLKSIWPMPQVELPKMPKQVAHSLAIADDPMNSLKEDNLEAVDTFVMGRIASKKTGFSAKPSPRRRKIHDDGGYQAQLACASYDLQAHEQNGLRRKLYFHRYETGQSRNSPMNCQPAQP